MNTTKYNVKRNSEKSTYTLRGILRGLTADKKLNDMELLFLDIWLKEQSNIPQQGDALDLIELITDTLEDGVISQDEKEEILSAIDCVLEYGNPAPQENEQCINELIGILKRVSCDDNLAIEEFNFLAEWLKKHNYLAATWPVSILSKRIEEIKEDGIVTTEEREHLLETLKQITGTRFSEDGATSDNVAEVWFDQIECLNQRGKKICFTGTFLSGNRKTCEAIAKSYGAITSKDVTLDLDILILGSTASKEWRFTSHGRKIEKAMKLKSQGENIVIISEASW